LWTTGSALSGILQRFCFFHDGFRFLLLGRAETEFLIEIVHEISSQAGNFTTCARLDWNLRFGFGDGR